MKQVFCSLLLLCSLLFTGCKDSNKTATTPTAANKETLRQTTTELASSNEIKAVNELCTCFNSFMANMNPRVKQILIDAGKSENPVTVLADELQKIESGEEQARLSMEFEQFQNSNQLQQCSGEIQRKYKLNENDSALNERILKIAGENIGCEMVYSLMKIGLSEQAMQMQQGNSQQ